MRPRKLSKLVFQFGKLMPTLDEHEIANALELAGLIELIEGEHWKYVETLKMRSIDPNQFTDIIGGILREHARRHGLT